MKKKLYDLTIEEFVRLLCGIEKVYEIECKVHGHKRGVEEDEEFGIKGTYDQIRDVLLDEAVEHPENKYLRSSIDKFENSFFDYHMELSDLDVYNYLEEKTRCFGKDRANIVLKEMEMWHCQYIDEERTSIINKKIDEGWRDYKVIEKEVYTLKSGERHSTGEVCRVIDYEDAYKKVFGIAYDFNYDRAICLLKHKIGGEQQNVALKNDGAKSDNGATFPEKLNTEKAKTLLQKAVKIGLCDSNYKWLKSKALLAYFADKASEYLELGKGEYDGKKKVSWKPFETLFGMKKLSMAKQSYQNTGTFPDGYTDVGKLFK